MSLLKDLLALTEARSAWEDQADDAPVGYKLGLCKITIDAHVIGYPNMEINRFMTRHLITPIRRGSGQAAYEYEFRGTRKALEELLRTFGSEEDIEYITPV